jgi:hypothetical protein
MPQCKTPHLLSFNQCGEDTQSGDESDTEGIIVVIVKGPEDYAGDLKDVERVNNLGEHY